MKPFDPYELMITPSNKKGEMIMGELNKPEPNLNLVRDLITLGANLDWKNEYGKSAIFTAIEWSHPEIARMLLDAGADVNIQDENGLTPLHWCVYVNNHDIARMLIDAGADVRIWSRNGNTALDWCAIYYRPEIEITIRDSKAERIYKSINKRINEGDITLKDMIVLATGWYEGSDEYNIVLDYCIRNKKNILKTRHIFKKTLEANCDITALTQEFKEFLKV
jgi:hypothetical protein